MSCFYSDRHLNKTRSRELIALTSFQEVEREISFRTECGLYYSYYKQMLQAPTLTEGKRRVLSWGRPRSLSVSAKNYLCTEAC